MPAGPVGRLLRVNLNNRSVAFAGASGLQGLQIMIRSPSLERVRVAHAFRNTPFPRVKDWLSGGKYLEFDGR
jgi:hypothetical protein